VHEASLVSGLIRQIESVVQQEPASRAVSVTVWLGALSHLSAAHFRTHFDRIAAGSVAAGATLHILESDDIHHPQAEAVLLRSVEVED
jgi:hydrogenase nickel incorporation protein HypA/HybF